ncbi:tubby C-terminal-like domain-containing protein [Penicillium desertorum]|uniref:Tubby C-terminal-like domain-containing protein n=1 Tax=Penicillium desertorum TaxID=1303715 RepID=A0A9W9WI95_9EURO|nr:tubby C-terminal-like domain-containing protein [Penicillium desertorum]
MSFENQAAVEAKEQHKRVKLTIERNSSGLALFDVVDGDRKVAVVGSENLQLDEEKVMLTYDDLNPKRKQSEVAWL